jgi:hypothetical protein
MGDSMAGNSPDNAQTRAKVQRGTIGLRLCYPDEWRVQRAKGTAAMFQPRLKDFDPRLGAIVDHLRAIDKELRAFGKSSGRRASIDAAAAGDRIAETIGPILNDIAERFRAGQQTAFDQASAFGNQALKAGAKVGGDAVDRIAGQTKQRPLVMLAVAIGVGILIGAAARRT